MNLEIRHAVESDLGSLLLLDSECFPPGNTDLEPAPPGEIETGVAEGCIIVAVSQSQVVGMLQWDQASSNEWELLTLAISSHMRNVGVGQLLMERFLQELSKSPYLIAVTCLTSPNNLAMQGLLEKFGFLQVGLVSDYFGPGKHRLRFQLN